MEQPDATEPHATDVRPRATVALVLFLVIAVLMAADVVDDLDAGVSATHVVIEVLTMILAAGGVGALWLGLQRTRARATELDSALKTARVEASRYEEEAREAMQGLGEAIDSQFERWALTPAEREVGLLLLKGLSHRDVAKLRSTSEATVRQQALTIYRKSGLGNRSELSAFFLEDLLLPRVAQVPRGN